jgi:transposase-like protein
MFICADCEQEVDEQDASPHGKSFPEPLCQRCMVDLLEGNYDSGPIPEPKTEEEKLLNQLFPEKRKFRKGSSKINIYFETERRNAKKNTN